MTMTTMTMTDDGDDDDADADDDDILRAMTAAKTSEALDAAAMRLQVVGHRDRTF
jgi:hypothetical protein